MPTQVYTPPTNNDTLGIYEIYKYANGVAEGILSVSFMFVVWIIVFVATKNYSTSRGFTLASFICFILSMIFSVIDLISPKIMYLFLFFLAGGALWIKLEAQSLQ